MADHENLPSAADHIGQAAGGITGVVAGAAIGVTAGPLGVLLGGIAGAIGGWWTGRALVEAAEDITEADDTFYRSDFDSTGEHPTDFENARRAYYLGHVAARNPDYLARSFPDIEAELRRGWSAGGAPGEWESVRGFASVGFERGKDRRRSRPETNRRSGV
ncbi:MAG TPA: hypothetical protein VJ867_16595 [Gemmatimonadaceae bacterium]|nr:hypothetical protein [Gemmatimonadaceae bacterium]